MGYPEERLAFLTPNQGARKRAGAVSTVWLNFQPLRRQVGRLEYRGLLASPFWTRGSLILCSEAFGVQLLGYNS